jgi:hypothetical protein
MTPHNIWSRPEVPDTIGIEYPLLSDALKDTCDDHCGETGWAES